MCFCTYFASLLRNHNWVKLSSTMCVCVYFISCDCCSMCLVLIHNLTNMLVINHIMQGLNWELEVSFFWCNKMALNTTVKCSSPMKATSNGVFQGDDPLDYALPLAILQICMVVVLTRGLAFLLRPLRQPRVIAEIIVSSSAFPILFV